MTPPIKPTLKRRAVRWLDKLSLRLREYAGTAELDTSYLRLVTDPCCQVSDDPPGTPCVDYLVGANGRCVYCDHAHECHNFIGTAK